MQAMKHASEGIDPGLIDVTRSPKQEYQWPRKKELMS